MSLLNVEHLTHGFGDRAIFDDVSFRLLKGEHIGLVGANGDTEYITAVRLQHAKILLEIGEISISTVANKVGISNASYLSALLKKHYGIRLKQSFHNLLEEGYHTFQKDLC